LRKIVLYSDQIIQENKRVDYELLRLLDKKNPSIGYIPSCSDLTRKYFTPKVKYYNELGISNIQYFDLDKEYDEIKINDVFKSDAIHLSGGNTFYFLYLLKKRNLVRSLQLYVEQGGILIGISAGSIILSKTIDMAQFGDEDIVGIADRSSLGIVDFQFMPHWSDDESNKYLDLLKDYSKVKKTTIYACNDGDGIVIDGDDIKFIGNVTKI
jgi:dipeptidase E